ncbi:MAG: PHP domain-containing protein, partial [Sphingobacteriia bacterium]|nr:PHP domain-containing protein [Sphingobacteriia bacterium]
MKKYITILFFFGIYSLVNAQYNPNNTQLSNGNDSQRTNLQIPNIPGFITLTGDFHSHTIFSDGEVWPTLRILEAWQEGLDVIAITDHLEYRPNKSYLQADHNTSY